MARIRRVDRPILVSTTHGFVGRDSTLSIALMEVSHLIQLSQLELDRRLHEPQVVRVGIL